jgi:hypothetical protein
MAAHADTCSVWVPVSARLSSSSAVYRNFAGCFQRVLIDGGVHRIFTVEDKQIFDEDFCAIKAEVVRPQPVAIRETVTPCSFELQGLRLRISFSHHSLYTRARARVL